MRRAGLRRAGGTHPQTARISRAARIRRVTGGGHAGGDLGLEADGAAAAPEWSDAGNQCMLHMKWTGGAGIITSLSLWIIEQTNRV